MAQPNYAIKYLGIIRVSKNNTYYTADIIADYPTATVAVLKADKPSDTVRISIDDSPMSPFADGEQQYIESGQSFVFDKDCSIRIGIYKAVS